MMDDHLFDADDDGYTALHWATQAGQRSMVEYLVKSCGFDLKTKDKVGLLYFPALYYYLWPFFDAGTLHTCMNDVIFDLC